MPKSYEQIPKGIYFCKNHKDSLSGYFIADQPWVKYCKTCALNAALSGRKIQKQLTSQELERKALILSVVEKFKKSINISEQIALYYAKLIAILQEKVKPLSDRIMEIEVALRQLTLAKESLQKLFEQQISGKIATFFEKQAKIIISSDEIKKQIQNIESNFGTIIEMKNPYQFEAESNKWNTLLFNYSQQAISQSDFMASKCKIVEVMEQFYDQFKAISKFTVNTQLDFGPSSLKHFDQISIDMTLTSINNNFLLYTDQTTTKNKYKQSPKTKGHLKLRSNRKIATDRDNGTFPKTSLKKTSLNDFETPRQWPHLKQSIKI